MIHGHGNHLANYNNSIKIDFSSNIWHQGMDEGLKAFLAEKITDIANYPEPDAASLKIKLAEHHRVSSDKITVFNGSTEAFYTIAQAYSGRDSSILVPSFSEYTDACITNNHKINYISNNGNWKTIKYINQLVWLANPNNPDGITLELNEIERLLADNPSTIFILDEAYIDLCYGVESAIPLLAKQDNLIIIRSLTKAFAIPGIRLGYILTSEAITKTISPFLHPWAVNTLAIWSGLYILENYHRLLPNKNLILEETTEFQEVLAGISQLKVYPSNANFFLVQSHHKTACELKEYLIKEHKILIRDASNFKALDETYFRLAIRGKHNNKSLTEAIKQWIKL